MILLLLGHKVQLVLNLIDLGFDNVALLSFYTNMIAGFFQCMPTLLYRCLMLGS